MNFEDKIKEKERYDNVALSKFSSVVGGLCGALGVVSYLRRPYSDFENKLRNACNPSSHVLELGCGTGEHTIGALQSGSSIVAMDISDKSLELLHKRYPEYAHQITLYTGDMESIEFEDDSFDVVFSAGSLSYGDNIVVLNHIYRLLRKGGTFICVDSLNENPIYRLNRYIHYLRGERALGTLVNMPTLSTISSYQEQFTSCEVVFYDSLTWCFPVLIKLVGIERTIRISTFFDRIFRIKGSAFKFVLLAKK